MAWYIKSTINNGYPYNTDFIGVITDKWTSNGNHNPGPWRIDETGKINNGYPWFYAWADYISESGGGTVVDDDGGLGSTYGDDEGTNDGTNWDGRGVSQIPDKTYGTDDHLDDAKVTSQIPGTKDPWPGAANSVVSLNAMSGLNVFATTMAGLEDLHETFTFLTDDETFWEKLHDVYKYQLVMSLFGSNIYNAVQTVKWFPVAIPVESTSSAVESCGINWFAADSSPFYKPTGLATRIDFGTIDLKITHGYEIAATEWSIYLPYCGYQPLPIEGNEVIGLVAYIDFLTGSIVYEVRSGESIIAMMEGKCCIDLPINPQQNQMAYNAIGKVTSWTLRGVSQITNGLGNVSADLLHDEITGGFAQNVSNAANKMADFESSSQVPISSTQIGSSMIGTLLPQVPRIIYRIPKVYEEAYKMGRRGYNTSSYSDNISSDYHDNDYIKCANYLPQSWVGVEAEREEIKRLMEQGVYL